MTADGEVLELPADPTAAGLARAFVTARLVRWELGELREAVILLTSEVVTNAVVHAAGPAVLRLTRLADGVRLEVTDGSPAGPARRQHSQQATTGRGLRLLEDLADEWGWQPTVVGPTVGSQAVNGKTVWFESTTSAVDPWVALPAARLAPGSRPVSAPGSPLGRYDTSAPGAPGAGGPPVPWDGPPGLIRGSAPRAGRAG